MITEEHLFIGGDMVLPHSTARLPVVNPATETIIGSIVDADAVDVDRAVSAAHEAFVESSWAALQGPDRARLLRKLANALEGRSELFAQMVTSQNGMPISTSRAAHGPGLGAYYRYFADLAQDLEVEETRRGEPSEAIVRKEPVGVAALITAWNGPQGLLAWKLAPALAAGCTAVVKPAPQTSLDAFLFADAVSEAGIPSGVVNVVTGDRDAGSALVRHPLVAKVAFTGSSAVGQQIAQACASDFKRLTLELGGKSAAILLEDVDLDAFVPFVASACSPLTGQTCRALTRILAPRLRYDEIVDTVARTLAAIPMGDPLDVGTVFGPLVSSSQRDRVESYIKLGLEEGAKIVVGGGRPSDLPVGYYVEPTVFRDVDNTMRIAQEEIFGPVLVVIPYDDEDDAIRIANDSRYGLGGGVFTRDRDHGTDVARRIRTGSIGVNTSTLNIRAPFGGMKLSGIGRELGPEGLSAYQEIKSIYRGLAS